MSWNDLLYWFVIPVVFAGIMTIGAFVLTRPPKL
jgi:hypothetical protein